jgi:hypothetical protein
MYSESQAVVYDEGPQMAPEQNEKMTSCSCSWWASCFVLAEKTIDKVSLVMDGAVFLSRCDASQLECEMIARQQSG